MSCLRSIELEECCDAETEKYIEDILKECDGLPPALYIANRWIYDAVYSNSSSLPVAVQMYTRELANFPSEYREGFGKVDKILITTMNHLEKRGRNTVTQKNIFHSRNCGNEICYRITLSNRKTN